MDTNARNTSAIVTSIEISRLIDVLQMHLEASGPGTASDLARIRADLARIVAYTANMDVEMVYEFLDNAIA